jgi:purine-binding chemotaxis protein CheW
VLGIDINRVEEVLLDLPITPIPRSPKTVAGLINLRGQILTAISLRRAIFETISLERTDSTTHVVVNTATGLYSLLTDRPGEVVDIEEHRFEPPVSTLPSSLRSRLFGVAQTPFGLVHRLNIDAVLFGEEYRNPLETPAEY